MPVPDDGVREMDTMRVRYVGGHSEVYNAETGTWKSGEVKEVPREVADLLLRSGSVFKLVEGDE
jgi:hypothetical protein